MAVCGLSLHQGNTESLKPLEQTFIFQIGTLKDVRAHCYCASLVRMLFIGHAHATSFSSACTESKTQQNIELMTFALIWCANIFVGCSVTPTFFQQITSFSDSFHFTKKQKKYGASEVLIISHILLKKVRIGTWIQVCVT